MVESFAGTFFKLVYAKSITNFCNFGLDNSMELPFADIKNQTYT